MPLSQTTRRRGRLLFDYWRPRGRAALIGALLATILLSTTTNVVHANVVPDQVEYVVRLDDDNFEHETQASTGQTTGSWMVWMYSGTSTALPNTYFAEPVPTEDDWLSNHVVLASVDVDTCPVVRKRFSLDAQSDIPMFVFIHKGAVYEYRLHVHNGNIYAWDDVLEFVTSEYKNAEAKAVPPPPGMLGGGGDGSVGGGGVQWDNITRGGKIILITLVVMFSFAGMVYMGLDMLLKNNPKDIAKKQS